ncbi:MAG: hypothetical protein GY751_13910 [Bacteroidetes bacterium]|nr:hypothetical protein [Bacteroidota bacterium]
MSIWLWIILAALAFIFFGALFISVSGSGSGNSVGATFIVIGIVLLVFGIYGFEAKSEYAKKAKSD